jgi:hypothetical protein
MSLSWSMLCLLGLWGFVAAMIGFILKSFPARGVFVAPSGLVWGALALIFFALWVVGMANA